MDAGSSVIDVPPPSQMAYFSALPSSLPVELLMKCNSNLNSARQSLTRAPWRARDADFLHYRCGPGDWQMDSDASFAVDFLCVVQHKDNDAGMPAGSTSRTFPL